MSFSEHDEDDDLKSAIAMSLTSQESELARGSLPSSVTTNDTATNGDGVTASAIERVSGFAGLDRKAMEAERLARRGLKRERSVSPPPLRSPRKAPKLEAKTVSLPSGARLTSFSTLVHEEQQSRKSPLANAANQKLSNLHPSDSIKQEPNFQDELKQSVSPDGTLVYPTGVVKKTWAFGFKREGSDIKLEEVLEPLTLRTAVLSAFQWNTEWVLRKIKTPLNGGSTKCVFVMQAKEETLRQKMVQDTEDMRHFLRLCFPPMDGQIHCMHSKLMLLFHPNKLRVAIPTANLLDFDWGETGVMENSVFMIDLPRLPDGRKAENGGTTSFAKELLYYVEKKGLDEDVRNGILNFDFSATEGMAFIHTVGGIHYGENAERTGLAGFGQAVRKLQLQSGDSLEIDFAASSIGSLNDDYLRNVHVAARGVDMIERAKAATSKAKADFFKPSAKKAPSESASIRDKLRIYFPTNETVTSSKAGAAGTICLSRKWYEAQTFPKGAFRDYRSLRCGLLSHNKILYARGKQQNADGSSQDVAWAYVGSANMSESAWGKLVYDKKEKAWKINCRNWECGVLLPIPKDRLVKHAGGIKTSIKVEKIEGEDSETESEGGDKDCETEDEGDSTSAGIVGMEVFDGIVPPPFEIPGMKYDGREPWYFQESH